VIASVRLSESDSVGVLDHAAQDPRSAMEVRPHGVAGLGASNDADRTSRPLMLKTQRRSTNEMLSRPSMAGDGGPDAALRLSAWPRASRRSPPPGP
jgi:hypothetical protein